MNLFNQGIDFYTQNQQAIQLAIAAVIYIVTHRQAAKSYAKSKAKTAIFAAEKWAEDLLLQSGAEKMDFVVQKVYAKMPGAVRMVVNLDKFRSLAQKVYDDAAASVKDQLPKDPALPSKIITDITQ